MCHGTSTRHTLHGYRRPVKRCEQPDRLVATRVRGRGRTGRSDGSSADLTPGSAHCTGKPRGSGSAPGGTQGGLNCLTHALPRCLPTPTEEADGNGYGVITGRGGPSRPPPRVSVNLVPLLLTGVRLHPPGRTDNNLCRCFGAPARRVSPDHLITYCEVSELYTSPDSGKPA